jgi:hypothetical protein
VIHSERDYQVAKSMAAKSRDVLAEQERLYTRLRNELRVQDEAIAAWESDHVEAPPEPKP